MITAQELQDEDRRVRHVRLLVNFTSTVIAESNLSRSEGEALVAAARAKILDLFPGRDQTYELLYARRFKRLLDEYTTQDPDRRGIVIPFPSRSR